jgi:hypothetical protein
MSRKSRKRNGRRANKEPEAVTESQNESKPSLSESQRWDGSFLGDGVRQTADVSSRNLLFSFVEKRRGRNPN